MDDELHEATTIRGKRRGASEPSQAVHWPLADGRYEIVRTIGSGGMGSVYEAVDRRTGAHVALKTLNQVDPNGIYQLKNEFRSMADVHHPNLVGLGDLVNDESLWFFTMDLVEGRDFKSYLNVHDDELIRRLRNVLPQLIAGVQAIHDAGKLHQDLKPPNVLVREDGHLVILDFGLVAEQKRGGVGQTLGGNVAGTPIYMSPEQARGHGCGPPTDWYAVGAMLYQAITRTKPFDKEPIQVLFDKQDGAHPKPPPKVLPELQPILQVATQMMDPDPARRPPLSRLLDVVNVSKNTSDIFQLPSPARDVFVGRDAESVRLWEAFSATAKGPSIVFVHGASGIGKTYMVRRFLEQVRDRHGAVVFAGRCYERESVPFKALDGIIDSLGRFLKKLSAVEAAGFLPRHIHVLALLFPTLARVDVIRERSKGRLPDDPQELRRLAVGALRELLGAIADSYPVVVTVDDLQWGDLDSASLLQQILKAPDAPPILLVTTHRTQDVERSPCLQLLLQTDFAGARCEKLMLQGLPVEDLERLSRQLLEGDPDSDPASVARDAEGSPYFVAELARFQRSGISTRGMSWRDAFLAHFDSLEPVHRNLLEVVSVASRPLPRALATHAAGAGSLASVAIRELDARHLLTLRPRSGQVHDDLLEAYHDRIRETIRARMPQERLRYWHSRLAASYEASDTSEPEILAHHYAESGDSIRASECAIVAARRASRAFAFNRAASLYRLGIELSRPDQETERALRVLRAEALGQAGLDGEAAREYIRVADAFSGARAARLRQLGAEHLLRSGRVEEGMNELTDTLERFGYHLLPDTAAHMVANHDLNNQLRERGLDFAWTSQDEIPAPALERVDLAWVLALAWAAVDGPRGGYFVLRCLHDVLALGEPNRVARAMCLYVAKWAALGRPGSKTIARVLDAARQVATGLDTPDIWAWLTYAEAAADFWQGRHEAAIPRLRNAWAEWRRIGNYGRERSTVVAYELLALNALGRFDEIRRQLEPLRTEAIERDDIYLGTWFNSQTWAVDVLADTPGRARDRLKVAHRQWSAHTGRTFDYPTWALILAECNVDLYEQEPARGWDRLEQALGDLSEVLPAVRLEHSISVEVRGRLGLALAYEDPKRRTQVLEKVDQDIKVLLGLELPCFQPRAMMLKAALHRARGALDQELKALEAALEGFEGDERNLSLAAVARLRIALARQDLSSATQVLKEMASRGVVKPEAWVELWYPTGNR